MNLSFSYHRWSLALLPVITISLIFLSGGQQSVFAQKTSPTSPKEVAHPKPALTLENILKALQSQMAPLPDKNRLLIQGVKERGVAFAMTSDIEQQLTQNGASKALIDLLNKEATRFQQTGVYYRNLADDFRREGNTDEAIANYNKALEISPDDKIAYINRGVIYDTLKRYDEAIADFSKAIEIDPTDKIAYINRGISYYNKNEYQKAIADYDKAIDIDPNSVLAYDSRANAHQMMGRGDLAEADRRKAREIRP